MATGCIATGTHDDFGRPETAFTICAFWYVNALAMAGRRDEAREHFERLLARRTRLGLLSEDIDPGTGEWWGNFPQTYSLVGIINSRDPPESLVGGRAVSRLVAVSNRVAVAAALGRSRAGWPSGCSRR